ncbi:response regulator [Amycolatopsis vancoresmycina]|uniref:Transcriptional regulator, KdpE family protein n=1 Tax=Amycolatopsis vancoresmycina DSM 44592 TaxID=1292037 RepID=R1HD95_9PSEU|nr:response regulator [Amycolatopsis vancoresmycina]EOD58416.1 Transcriptional regulator, KdpE family protein [Amycolatopsis vancoresmycina DSM 44592]
MTSVLVVDDEAALVRALRINLTARGYSVVTATDGASALLTAATERPDLVLLDLGLPDIDGIEVIRELRTWSAMPIIVLSARDTSADKIRALDTGADTYVTKPFGMEELFACLRVAERRLALGAPEPDLVVETAAFTVDVSSKTVRRGAVAVHLTRTEWAILEQLVRNPDSLVSGTHLLTTVWGPEYADRGHYLRVYLAQLRRKLEPDPARPRYLITETGIGYRFAPEDPP